MTSKTGTITLHTQVPSRLFQELQALVDAGWSRDIDEIVLDALRRYAESHRESLASQFIREDVEWGLRGSD
ncbi:MAG TPA: CopG family transcriptional regulator [Thermoanaerobaculia bacterium]|nr:CopG family transcriptional regulator [Thermoanaerobaculia bacterium]